MPRKQARRTVATNAWWEWVLQYQQPAMAAKAKPFFAALSMPGTAIFALGCAALALPTLFQVARDSWSTEQGGHGPLVLATGIWALWRELRQDQVERRPGKPLVAVPILALLLTIFVLARITGILEVEAFAVYGALIASAYLLVGSAVLRAVWFPLVYLGFTLPPPDSAVAAITQPIKIAISEWAVTLLHTLGYPIASSGVTIQIGQYQLLVAAACAGLNSIVTLAALCMFYVYLQHRSNPRAFLLMMVAAIPIAIIANFVRVLALVLITYHFGEAAAQGFLHDFAGIFMFAVALATVFAIDKAAAPLFAKAPGK